MFNGTWFRDNSAAVAGGAVFWADLVPAMRAFCDRCRFNDSL